MINKIELNDIITLETGYQGRVKQVLTNGHKDIRPPYTLSGALILEPIHPFICEVKVLPAGMPKMYNREVMPHEIKNITKS